MRKKRSLHHVMIILYGIILLTVLTGAGNLFGSRVDWLSQHTVFPDTFRHAFYESGKLIPEFLFDIGGGQNIFHFTYYGLLSPLILPSYVLPFVDMTTYIICMSVLSYLASGCLIYEFLQKKFQKNNAFWAGILFLTLPPMTFHFHRHVMFVWYMPFFILGLMGIDRYFEKKKSGLFVMSVCCMILTNYMFSVGCMVFLFAYTVFQILKKEHFLWKEFGKIIAESILLFLIPVFMTSFLLLPTAYGLFSNERSGGNEITFWDMMVPSLEEYFYSPYSMGISAVMLVVVVCNLTCKKKKMADLFLTLFTCFILLCPIILYVLNGTLYIRGKALIACSVLFLYQFCQFLEWSQQNEIQLKKAVLISAVGILLLIALRWENGLTGTGLLVELLLLYYFRKKKNIWQIAPILVALLATFVSNWSSETYVTKDYYEEMYTTEIAELMTYTEGNFYRTNIAYREMDTANRVYGENFHGTSVYSSTYNSLYQLFYDAELGNNEVHRNAFMTTGVRNEYFYQFIGTKYIIGKKDPGMQYELVKKGEHLNLYENKKAFPVVYKSQKLMDETEFSNLEFPYNIEALMTHTILEEDAISCEDSSQINDNLFEKDTSSKSITKNTFEKAEILDAYIFIQEKTEIPKSYTFIQEKAEVSDTYTFIQEKEETYTINLDEHYRNKIIYLEFDIQNEGAYQNEEDIWITINGVSNKLTDVDWLYYNGNTTFTYIIPMEDTTNLRIQIAKGKYDIRNLNMYASEPLETAYAEAEDLRIDKAASTITCKVIAEKGEYLVTSFPYDKGFSVYINGKETEIQLVNEAFLGIPLQEGENEVEIQYHAPFFRWGILISCLGICLWVIQIIYIRKSGFFCATKL